MQARLTQRPVTRLSALFLGISGFLTTCSYPVRCELRPEVESLDGVGLVEPSFPRQTLRQAQGERNYVNGAGIGLE